ncbi:beta-1,3-galactosyltransferase 2-like [Lampris incognitus]|uniref:beta-1,3-galactosyltransferase 2-like n=1 Tax=Lampris incognitus TaxID=2546036 RepID=UPI0024B48F65|nr:beta-1,3-galactosyltransferase 2-like [Lampris incognitus]
METKVTKPDGKKSLNCNSFLYYRFLFLVLFTVTVVCSRLLCINSLTWFPAHVHYPKTPWINRTHEVNMTALNSNMTALNSNTTALNGNVSSMTTTLQYHSAHPRNYRFIMDNTEACKVKTPFLVLMVPVAPGNLAARHAIRKTWGNETLVQGELVQTFFMLGLNKGPGTEQQQEALKQENLLHHDLIQSNFMDTYQNLTTKTMVIMDWLVTHCPNASYAMKVDSDMFLNIENLVNMLKKPDIPKVNYLTGMLMWNRPVVRTKNSKWYVPEELYPDHTYPTYTLGMGYIFSNDLPEKFVEISKSIKPFNIEDAYIGMCMKLLGLTPSGPPNPSQFKAYNSGYNRCEFSQVITYILGSAQQLVKYWTDLKKPGSPC